MKRILTIAAGMFLGGLFGSSYIMRASHIDYWLTKPIALLLIVGAVIGACVCANEVFK